MSVRNFLQNVVHYASQCNIIKQENDKEKLGK